MDANISQNIYAVSFIITELLRENFDKMCNNSYLSESIYASA